MPHQGYLSVISLPQLILEWSASHYVKQILQAQNLMGDLWLPSSTRLTPPKRWSRISFSFSCRADWVSSSLSLLFKLLNGKLLLEFMPLIQRLLQRNTGSPGSEVEPGPLDSNTSLHSSLPESAFLDILSALGRLPDFPQLLTTTVNDQGQTLLHLAVHLRYRELVQKLVHWGIDPNIRDISGCTALHAAYLCNDPFVVGILEAEGATPFVLDELGRSPAELAVTNSCANRITTRNDEEVVPSAVGRSKEQRRLEELKEDVFTVNPGDPKLWDRTWELEKLKEDVITTNPGDEKIIEERLLQFFEQVGDRFYCRIPINDPKTGQSYCNYEQGRKRRILGHLRMHLNFRPFVCGGDCGTPSW